MLIALKYHQIPLIADVDCSDSWDYQPPGPGDPVSYNCNDLISVLTCDDEGVKSFCQKSCNLCKKGEQKWLFIHIDTNRIEITYNR